MHKRLWNIWKVWLPHGSHLEAAVTILVPCREAGKVVVRGLVRAASDRGSRGRVWDTHMEEDWESLGMVLMLLTKACW